MDLYKAFREMEFPEIRRPKRTIWIEPTLEDICEFKRNHIDGASLLSVDIETAGNQITNIGFAPGSTLALNIPFVDFRKSGRNYWTTKEDELRAWRIIKSILECPTPPKLFQNGLYDISFLWRGYGIGVRGATHDTMLLHHAMQPESLKSLGFLGSLYADETNWKTMRTRGKTTIKRDD
jgi:DNA polymerase I-like protein with 3'-5' exonuclease and polymerase domains